jgi:hypothetical protein
MKKNFIAKQITESNALIIDGIVDIVIKEWNGRFSRDDLFFPNIKGDVVSARNMILVIAKRATDFTPKEISKYFPHVEDYTVRSAIRYYNSLDKGNKYDKIIIDRYQKLLTQIKNG